MSSRIDEIRAAHRMETDTDTDAEGRAVIVAFCAEDDADWPCDIAHLLALVERLTAENAEFRQQMRSAIREVEQSTKRWESLHAIRDAATARAEAAVRGETLVEPEYAPPVYPTESPVYPTQSPAYPTQSPGYSTESPTYPTHTLPSSEMKPPAASPTYPEFLNADGTVPRRPCGATTVITLRNRDHVIECQEEVRDATADHPHYGLPHLALITTGKRGHRVFIGWHEEE
jgi:hypothetical protein